MVPLRWLVLGCVAVAALSLLGPAQPTYDPTAWLIWGREIVHGELTTTFGPSWKPLPALVTIPGGLLSLEAQQDLWLVVARAGGLMAVVMGFTLARRLAGGPAGAIAAAGIVLAQSFVSHTFRGDSEGLLAAFAIGAYEAHAAGRRNAAFALVALAALLRPEMLLFAGLYGLWLLWRAPPARRLTVLAVLVGVGVVIVAAWLVPEEIGSGKLLRAASRARQPVPNSPAQASFPFLATFTNAAPVLMWPLYAGGFFVVGQALLAARRTRTISLELWIALGATVLMIVVALMAEGGFTGNIRYLTVASTLAAVLGGVGLVRIGRLAADHAPASWQRLAIGAVALAIGVPTLLSAVDGLAKELRDAQHETHYYDDLPDAIAAAGGKAAVLGCGAIYSNPFDTQALARDLGVHEMRVTIHPGAEGAPPGIVFMRRRDAIPPWPDYHVIDRTSRWTIAAHLGTPCA